MAYRFSTEAKGSAVEVIDDGKTVLKPDPCKVMDSVVLTTEALRVGEPLEVLVELVLPIDHGGLEIGVTTNQPTSPLFKPPRTMTECVWGVTYMISGRNIVCNNQRIHHVDREHSTHKAKVGDVLGVRISGLGFLQFLLNGKCICSIAMEEDSAMYGVIDLFGRCRQASIYTGQAVSPKLSGGIKEIIQHAEGDTTPVENVYESVKLMLDMMQAKMPRDIEILQSVQHSLWLTGKMDPEKNKEIAAQLCTQDAARIFVDYTDFIKDLGRVDFHRELFKFIPIMCKESMEFSVALGKAGIFRHLVDDLSKVHKIPRNYQVILMLDLHIIRQLITSQENVVLLRQLGYVRAARACADSTSFAAHFVIPAVLTLATVMEENEADLLKLDHACLLSVTIKRVLSKFQDAIADDDHKCDDVEAMEFCACLTKLASNFHNLKEVVSANGHVLFARLLKNGSRVEKESAAVALHAHTCPQSYKLIARVPGMLELLEATAEDDAWTERTREVAMDALTQLLDYRSRTGDDVVSGSSVGGFGDIGGFGGGGGNDGGGAGGQGRKFIDSVAENPKFPVGLYEAADFDRELAEMSMREEGSKRSDTCRHMAECRQVLESLAIQEAYLSHHHDRCFCVSCHGARKVGDYSKRGDPPSKYSLPIGWCRFGLSVPPKTKALKVHERWHKAFHGTKQRYLAKILELGELVVPGHVVLGGEHMFERSVHLAGGKTSTDSRKIFVSPSIHYAGHEVYADPELYISHSGEQFYVRVAFEIFIAPGSYKAGEQTIGLKEQIDPGFSNSLIEWTTVQQGSNVLYGLLIKLEKVAEGHIKLEKATTEELPSP